MGVIQFLAALSNKLNHAVTVFCVACLAIMLGISFLGSFYMVATGDALSWTYSLARLFVPWIGLLSITVAFKSGEHVAMSVLVSRLPHDVAVFIGYFNVVVIGLFAAMLVWFGWEFFVNSTQHYMVSDQLQIHHRWVAAAVPVTGLILLLHVFSGLALLEPPALLESTDTDTDAALQ